MLIQKIEEKGNNIYIGREDLLPFSFGGNKARKAELFFADIIRNKCKCVITYGSSHSNHCRIIANKACSVGLECYIVMPKENDSETYNKMLVEKLFGAKIIFCDLGEVKETIEILIERNKDKNPYFIQGGGHGNLGTKAYVEALDEIIEFEKIGGINFDYIFLASGTGTTQAGLICGSQINNKKTKIIGISIARKEEQGTRVVLDSVKDYMEEISFTMDETVEVNFIDDYIADGYGKYNNEIISSIKTMMRENGISLNTTYTGKAYWGMKEYIKKNKINNKNILFINTGGTPLFFDDLEEIIK